MSAAGYGKCIHCGVANTTGKDCCSSGCDLARRLPLGEAALPATWQLGVVLAWGFAAFNQLLFAGMNALSVSRNDLQSAQQFAVASLVAGALVALANLFFLAIAQPKRVADWQALAVSLAAGAVLGHRLGNSLVVGFGAANLLLCFWISRGLWLRASPRKH